MTDHLSQSERVIALTLNTIIAWLIFFAATGDAIPTGSGASIWLLAAVAHWVLILIAAPFFLPPRDSLSTAISVVLLLAPLSFMGVIDFRAALMVANGAGVALAALVATGSLVAIFQRSSGSRVGQVAYRLSSTIGKGEILFTPAVMVSALGFYQNQIGWMFVILAFWTFMIIVRPIELAIKIWGYLLTSRNQEQVRILAGTVLRIDDPNIARIVLAKGALWEPETVHMTCLSNEKMTYILPLFTQIQNDDLVGTGFLCSVPTGTSLADVEVGSVYALMENGLATRLTRSLNGDDEANQIVGIVAEGSSISDIKFQVVSNAELQEGMVVFTCIRGKKIYYQILDAKTNEKSFQQHPLGTHVASAGQLGSYDAEHGFQKFPWLPMMNQPLFLASKEREPEQKLEANEFMIGKVPFTPFGVPVNLDHLIEYHTAVLGITGTGKTELALDIIRNALARDTKVFCVDFTGEYKARLADQNPQSIGLSIQQGGDLEKHLFAVETGTYGAAAEKATLKNFLDVIKPQVSSQIETFLTTPEQQLGIFELAEITNTKATLRTTEMYLSAIMSWAKKNRKVERILIVLEEAHTIIPEAFGGGFDHDTQWVVGRIGQIALQGRKYGVGLLLVSQRTALVSKTVLSQCNTYFTHSLVDKTSLDYLSSVYSEAHVKAIPNLRFLEFLAHGKAVKSERPLIVKSEFDQAKKDASRALDKKKEVIKAPHEASPATTVAIRTPRSGGTKAQLPKKPVPKRTSPPPVDADIF